MAGGMKRGDVSNLDDECQNIDHEIGGFDVACVELGENKEHDWRGQDILSAEKHRTRATDWSRPGNVRPPVPCQQRSKELEKTGADRVH